MSERKVPASIRAVWAIPILAALAVILGTWGWLHYGIGLNDALYRSIALFDNNNDIYGDKEGLADWRFRTGRWLGAIVVFSTALLALGTLLQQRVSATLARRTKQSVTVIGGDVLATTAFDVAQRAGRSALWLGAPAFGSANLRTIALPWPPQDRARSVIDHAGGSDHIIVAHEDDAEALTLARAARIAAPEAYITVLMRDVRLAEDAGATLNEAKTRVLSQGAIAARSLAIANPPFLIAKERGHERIHALIIGFGQTGHAILRDLIVNCRATYLGLPRITVIDPHAKALEGVLRVRAPELDACAEARFIVGEISSRAVHPEPAQIARTIAEAGPITAAYVCLNTDVDALSASSTLQSLLRSIDLDPPPIFVRVRELNTIAPGGQADRGLDALKPFGDLASILTASEFLSSAPDAAARAFNEAYRASLTPEQRSDPRNRSANAWDDLDETYRQANRDAVAHIPAKLASAGVNPGRWRWVTGLPVLGPGERLYDGPEQLEPLAELEHERWLAQRRMDGWRWTSKPSKNEVLRQHPSLVPYNELSDEVKEYDRVYVRQTQAACAAPE
jgi:hypothetical protein